MDVTPINRDLLLEKAQALISSLESAETSDDQLETQIDEINSLKDNHLFQELGKMTREIHDSIMQFRMDSRISDLAETDIPDAKDRLEYVITMTEKAANTAMGVIEEGSPVAEKLGAEASVLKAQWNKFRNRELSADELRAMGNDVEAFFDETELMMSKLLSGFTEILMAQDFQDLTGQIIRQVINLVNEIETNLVELIKIQGEGQTKDVPEKLEKKEETKLDGPQVPGKETSNDVMKGQDDVDDLLASLGF
ncbi:Chemotaxis response - phosphatase CheZ [hydrothermal vent metagenome]|uniref:Protein phosphatase CheZ n=1 Tax=hydrothermal vent metagenome TaxID=652676 RepID=A0A3B0XCZ7_9ZZZZ